MVSHRPGPLGRSPPRRAAHLGSVRPAVCRTRPQYVLRSYRDSGRALGPGSEADIVFYFSCRAGSNLESSSGENKGSTVGGLLLGRGRRKSRGRQFGNGGSPKAGPPGSRAIGAGWEKRGLLRRSTAVKGILSKRPKMTPNSVGGRTQHSGARIANAAATPTDRGRRLCCCCGCSCGCAMCTRPWALGGRVVASCRGDAATASSPPTMDGQTSKEPSFHPAASKQATANGIETECRRVFDHASEPLSPTM